MFSKMTELISIEDEMLAFNSELGFDGKKQLVVFVCPILPTLNPLHGNTVQLPPSSALGEVEREDRCFSSTFFEVKH